MTVLQVSTWRYSNHPTNTMQTLATDTNITKIILFSQQEYDFYRDSRFQKLAKYSDEHNIPFYCVANISDPENVHTDYKSVKIEPWKTFWLSTTVKLLSTNPATNQLITIPFISMNRRAHVHRCAMMDSLAKYDLIEKGAISWLRLNVDENTGLEKYVFKHWKPTLMMLTDGPKNPLRLNIFNLPGEYHRSFMHLVTETSGTFNVITEKTVFPLLLKKPFLVLGGVNNHLMLQDYGFKLYDEIFDYSYAQIADINERCDALAKQVADIANKPIDELIKLREVIHSKLEFNAVLARKLALDISYIPNTILEAYNDPNNVYCSRDIVEFVINNKK